MSIWSMGWGEFGQTGQGGPSYEIYPAEIPHPTAEAGSWGGMKQLCGGHSHTMVLMDDGVVYGWGRATEGQLHPSAEASSPDGKHVFEPIELGGLPHDLQHLGAAGVYSAGVTSKGQVFTWGSGGQGQLGRPDVDTPAPAGILETLPSMRRTACGWGHVLNLTEGGELYAHGFSEWGQLGLGSGDSRASPTLLNQELFGSMGVIDVATGLDHSLALSEDGRVWTWGFGGNGQLGHGDCNHSTIPREIEMLRGLNVIQVSGGWSHSAAVTQEGELWVWGGGENGQLGLGSHALSDVGGYVCSPTLLEIGDPVQVTQISLGRVHSACVTSDGALYTWGSGHKGRLGHGGTENEMRPSEVPLEDFVGEEGVAVTVCCGLDHTIVAIEEA